jgi:rhodanese-related sulfurtransferase
MSMWQGQRIPEVTVRDYETGSVPSVMLDVREAREWEAGHVEGAIWVPMGELERARFELPMNRRIACICRSGQRSARAVVQLKEWGFDAANVVGGIKAWVAEGKPIVRDDGSPGQVV